MSQSWDRDTGEASPHPPSRGRSSGRDPRTRPRICAGRLSCRSRPCPGSRALPSCRRRRPSGIRTRCSTSGRRDHGRPGRQRARRHLPHQREFAVRPDPADFRDAACLMRSEEMASSMRDSRRQAPARVDRSDSPKTSNTGRYPARQGYRARCEPAPLTVAFTASDGNCLGSRNRRADVRELRDRLHVGSKTTLMMTALPLAESRGAKLFTGGKPCSPIMPSVPRLSLDHGCDERPARRRPGERGVSSWPPRSDSCAGTLGALEFLKRSEALHG